MSGKYVVEPGDVVFSKIRPSLRKVVLADFSGICSADMYPLRPRAEILGGFLLATLLGAGFSQYVANLAGRTGIPKVNRRDLKGFWVAVPTLTEQRRIVEVIDSVSAQERAIEASAGKLESIRNGILAELQDVECGRLEDVLRFGPQNGLYKPATSYGPQGAPIVRIDSFEGGPSDFTRNLLRVSLGRGEVHRYGLAVGDVIINRVNTPELVGKSTVVAALAEPTVFESNIMRCRVDADLAAPEFVETWLMGARAKAHFRQRAKSAISQASINSTDVRACPFPRLSIAEQSAFVARLAVLRSQQRSEEAELEKLTAIKRGVIDDLLT